MCLSKYLGTMALPSWHIKRTIVHVFWVFVRQHLASRNYFLFWLSIAALRTTLKCSELDSGHLFSFMILWVDWDQLDGLLHVMSAGAVDIWGMDLPGTSKRSHLQDGAGSQLGWSDLSPRDILRPLLLVTSPHDLSMVLLDLFRVSKPSKVDPGRPS